MILSAMKLLLSAICMCGILSLNRATLTIEQGRIITMQQNETQLQKYSVIGIATVDLSGEREMRPTYFFDCITDQNDTTGLRWTRMTRAMLRFTIVPVPEPTDSPGQRMRVEGMNHEDLGVYICSDTTNDDIVSINITIMNPAVIAVKQKVEAFQGSSADLKVFVSGYPPPNGSHITWLRPDRSEIMESDEGVLFEDDRKSLALLNVHSHQAGLYTCRVSLPPNISARADILMEVYDKPTIDLFSLSIIEEANFVYRVPLDYVGDTLVCSVHGRSSEVNLEWHKDGLPLISDSDEFGIISEPSNDDDTVTAQVVLVWTREFTRMDAGTYECVVYGESSNSIIASQRVHILLAESETHWPDDELNTPCSVDDRSVYFQIRVLGTGCQHWSHVKKEHVAAEFHQMLLVEAHRECQCDVDVEELRVLGVPQCSILINEAAVFHGLIQTNSIVKTEQIFCAVYSWQMKAPSLLIDDKYQTVDTSCYMEARLSVSDEECSQLAKATEPEHNKLKINMYLVILGGTGGFVLIITLLLMITCVGYCFHVRAKKKPKPPCAHTPASDVPVSSRAEEEHTYDHIDFSMKYGQNGPTSFNITSSSDQGYSSFSLSADHSEPVGGNHPSHALKQGCPLPPTPGSEFLPLNPSVANGLSHYEFQEGWTDQPLNSNPKLSGVSMGFATDTYEYISSLDLELDKEEAQPYSEPIKSTSN